MLQTLPNDKATPEQIKEAFEEVKSNKADYDARIDGALNAIDTSIALIYTVFRIKGRKSRRVKGTFWITPDGAYTTDKNIAKTSWAVARTAHIANLNRVAKAFNLKEIENGL